MPNEVLNGLIQAWGLPVAFVIWFAWERMKNTPKTDPTKELLDTLKSLDNRVDDIKDRVVRVETKLEMMGK